MGVPDAGIASGERALNIYRIGAIQDTACLI